jgi:beta-galactosidase
MPRTLVVDDVTGRVLTRFVKTGGTLFCESECGAFDSAGLYRYPVDRFTTKLTGIREIGRRSLKDESFEAEMDGVRFPLGGWQWLTPWDASRGDVLAAAAGGSLLSSVRVGKGRMVLCGTYLGEAYIHQRAEGLEPLVKALVTQAGYQPEVTVESPAPQGDAFVYIKYGQSRNRRLVFVFFPAGDEPVRLRFRKGWFTGRRVRNILDGASVSLERQADGSHHAEMAPPALRIAVLVGEGK